jgi:hypothetical protein
MRHIGIWWEAERCFGASKSDAMQNAKLAMRKEK